MKNKLLSFLSKVDEFLFPDYTKYIPKHVFLEIEDNATFTITTVYEELIT